MAENNDKIEKSMFEYDEEFYKNIELMEKDEKEIIPLIIQWLSPTSIVDFGCGEGKWLREVLEQNGAIDILGIDGSYVNKERLKIPKGKFIAADLRRSIFLKRKFDLAISTEVAEHLEEIYSDVFIDNIVRSSDNILFSAAVPGQGGTNHINEQWQSYWIQKFEKRGYYCDYSVRNYFWNKVEIKSWRKQNLLFFSKNRRRIAPDNELLNVVHPEEFIRCKKTQDRLRARVTELETYIRLDSAIVKCIKPDKKIVIYPYGVNGKLCEKILLSKYCINNYIISDNKAVVYNKKIFKAEQLQDLKDEILVIETCNNPLLHNEVLKEIQKYVKKESIYSAFEITGT